MRVADAFGYLDYSIGITVTNSAPAFSTNPGDLSISPTLTYYYEWPSKSDAEGHTISLSMTSSSWYSYNDTHFTMSPTII